MSPKPDYWTIYYPDGDLGRDGHPSPARLWKALMQLHWTHAGWRKQGMSFAHVRYTRTGLTVRLFKTLSAAKHFHKTLRPPA